MTKRPQRNQKQDLERSRKRREQRQAKSRELQARLTPRGAYTLFEHPHNLFHIEFPSDWKHAIEDDGRSVSFRPNDRTNVALSCYIMPYSLPVEAIVDDPKLVEFCEQMFAHVNAVNPRGDATIPYFAMKADRNQAGMDGFFETAVKVLHSSRLGSEPLDDVRDEIFPFIRPDSLGAEEGRLVKSEWLADLTVAYVIRIPSGFRYLTEFDLERWGIEREALHQLAIDNLSQLNTAAAMPEVPEGALPFVMLAAGDNMEASRLLHPKLYERFAESLGGPFIAAIPCRDALILCPNDKQLRRSVQQLVRKDYETSAYGITDRLFLVTPDGTTLAEW